MFLKKQIICWIKKIIVNQKTPLLIIFHGYGSNEKQIIKKLINKKYFKKFFIISIRGIFKIKNYTNHYCWYYMNVYNTYKEPKIKNIKQVNLVECLIKSFIQQKIKKYNLNKNNIWFMGYSQGAMLCYSMAINNPNMIKKVIILSGFINTKTLHNTVNNYIKNNVSFFISHGYNDNVIPIKLAKLSLDILKKYRIKYKYIEYVQQKHEISLLNYLDMITWIYQELNKK